MQIIFVIIIVAFVLALVVVAVAGTWKTFEKAGKPGWAAIVPIYVWIVKLEIAEKPVWWIIFLLVPFLNYVGQIVVPILWGIEIAKKFDKSSGFGVGLGLLPFIFFPILGFGDAEYIGAEEGGMSLEG